MILVGREIGYLPFDSTLKSPLKKPKETYISIAGIKYNFVGDSVFSSFNFKLNKRGGESGQIVFSYPTGEVGLQDHVSFVFEDKKVFSGVVEKTTDEGITLDLIPLWGLLDSVYLTGFEIEITDTFYNILYSLKTKIESVGILWNDENINIPDTTVTVTLTGNTVRQVLDELESLLPESIAWGVDGNSFFYFKTFSETASVENKIVWHSGDFSESTYSIDYSNLYSSYMVKVKTQDGESYTVLDEIVGDSDIYPALPFTDFIGKKTGVYEINYYVPDETAYELAYNALKNQFATENASITNINHDIEINTAYDVTLKPLANSYQDFSASGAGIIISNFIGVSDVAEVGYDVGENFEVPVSAVDFASQSSYQDACDRSNRVERIIVSFKSKNQVQLFTVTDGTKSIKQFSNGDILDVKGLQEFNKRKLSLVFDVADGVVVDNVRVFFTQGAKQVKMNCISIDFSYGGGIIKRDASFSKLNALQTGYFWKEQQRLKSLEELLSN